MSSILDRIPLTLPHYFEFGENRELVGDDLISPDAWDAIRQTAGPFGIAGNEDAFHEAAAAADVAERGRSIGAVALRMGARRVCSYGIGTGIIERSLLNARPDLELVCTDYAPRTVERLRELLPEADVRLHDLRRDPPISADFHLMHRIDSEFADSELRSILGQFDRPVLLVATQLLDLRAAVGELRRRFGRSATPAGYVRTEAALMRLWRATHTHERLRTGDHTAYLLRPRR